MPAGPAVLHVGGGDLMSMAAEYCADVIPMYSYFIIGDPYCDAEEDDAPQAREAARAQVIAATRYHAHLLTAQQVTKVHLRLRVWNNEPESIADQLTEEPWERHRSVTIECPEARLIFDNITAGAVTFDPDSVYRIDLPGEPGTFAVRVATQGRDDINRLIVVALSAESEAELTLHLDALGGHERYLIDVWRTGPLTDDDEEEDD